MKKIICIMAAACLALSCLTACGSTQTTLKAPAATPSSPISVWYVDDGSTMFKELATLVSEYNSHFDSKLNVALKSFKSDSELVDGLKSGDAKPSMVMCGRDAALSMAASDVTACTDGYFNGEKTANLVGEYVDACKIGGKLVCVPLAVTADLLMVNSSLLSKVPDIDKAAFSSPQSICKAAVTYENATGEHFFTACSFVRLFQTGLVQLGGSFFAQRSKDIDNESYVNLYNLLAKAAYDGGVTASDDDPAALVAEGKLACALVTAADVVKNQSQIKLENTQFYAYPTMEGGKALYPVSLYCMAITAGDKAQQNSAAQFMSWLIANNQILTAQSGYFSVKTQLSEAAVNSAGENAQLIKKLLSTVKLSSDQTGAYISAPDAGYFDFSEAFEISFRETLSGLN